MSLTLIKQGSLDILMANLKRYAQAIKIAQKKFSPPD